MCVLTQLRLCQVNFKLDALEPGVTFLLAGTVLFLSLPQNNHFIPEFSKHRVCRLQYDWLQGLVTLGGGEVCMCV